MTKKLLLLLVLCAGTVGSFAQVNTVINTHNASCGHADGSAVATPFGGSLPYTFLWSTGDITDSVSNLSAGAYQVTVYSGPTDSTVAFLNIVEDPAPNITITYSPNDTICVGGSVTLSASGGTGTFTWSGGDITGTINGNSITRTPPQGNHNYTVSSGVGACAATEQQTISVIKVLASLVSIVQPDCGQNSGVINCAGQGSVMRFTFLKNGAVAQVSTGTTTLPNAGPGTYIFIVDDLITGCSDSVKNIVLTDQGSVPPSFGAITIGNIGCAGGSNGSIHVNVNNCSGGCSYSWSHDALNHTDSAVGLSAGTYTFSVSGNGCGAIDTPIKVNGPQSALNLVLTGYNDNCSQSNGKAVAVITGGTAPFSFLWSNGSTVADSLTNLTAPDTVGLIVTDQNGCIDSGRVTIGSTGTPTGYMIPSDTICGADQNGRLSVVMTSNDGPFKYLWSNGKTSASVTNLGPGNYTVTVSNNGNCNLILTSAVPGYNISSYLETDHTSIYKGQNTRIVLNTTFPPSTVTWSPYIYGSENDQVVYVQPQDTITYYVTSTIGKNCISMDSITINVIPDTLILYVPNLFTPNGDGINDNFHLRFKVGVEKVHVWVYDRWGNKVFESTDLDFQWSGNNPALGPETLPTAVFAYVLEYYVFGDSNPKKEEGNVSLVR
ncbi:MAG: gliding motility-associated C-terminal domain-containing protein [Chitinophagales bacterium]